jgi:hypothetical protein
LSPLILTPQILFSGTGFKLRNASKFLSNFINCRWSVRAFLSLIDVNSLPANDYTNGITFVDAAYDPSASNIYSAWGVLFFFTALCVAICAVSLEGAE